MLATSPPPPQSNNIIIPAAHSQLLQEGESQSTDVCVAQHLSPTIRAARTHELQDLPASAILRRVTDAHVQVFIHLSTHTYLICATIYIKRRNNSNELQINSPDAPSYAYHPHPHTTMLTLTILY